MAENYKILTQEFAAETALQNAPLFVTVTTSTSNKAAYSTNGITWTQATLPTSANWISVAYGDGKFVAVAGGSYGSATAAHSTDAITWTLSTLPSNSGWQSVAYGDGKFVVVGFNLDVAAYSTNGIAWTETTLPSNNAWVSVTYGDGKFVAFPSYGSISAAYSTNGIAWTETTLPDGANWKSVAYGDGGFAVVSASDKAAYSTNGITWIQTTLPTNTSWISVAYGDGKFVTVPYSYGSTTAAYSTNGTTWTQATVPADAYRSVAYGDGKFVIVSYNPNTITGAYSTDGITWTQTVFPGTAPDRYQSVTYGESLQIQLLPNKTVYTAPSSTQTLVSSISIINNDTVPHTYSLGVIKAVDAGTAGISATQTLIPTRTVEPGVVEEIVGGIALSAGDQVRTSSDSTDLIVHIYGVELS
jgi:hypothetical protein